MKDTQKKKSTKKNIIFEYLRELLLSIFFDPRAIAKKSFFYDYCYDYHRRRYHYFLPFAVKPLSMNTFASVKLSLRLQSRYTRRLNDSCFIGHRRRLLGSTR